MTEIRWAMMRSLWASLARLFAQAGDSLPLRVGQRARTLLRELESDLRSAIWAAAAKLNPDPGPVPTPQAKAQIETKGKIDPVKSFRLSWPTPLSDSVKVLPFSASGNPRALLKPAQTTLPIAPLQARLDAVARLLENPEGPALRLAQREARKAVRKFAARKCQRQIRPRSYQFNTLHIHLALRQTLPIPET